MSWINRLGISYVSETRHWTFQIGHCFVFHKVAFLSGYRWRTWKDCEIDVGLYRTGKQKETSIVVNINTPKNNYTIAIRLPFGWWLLRHTKRKEYMEQDAMKLKWDNYYLGND